MTPTTTQPAAELGLANVVSPLMGVFFVAFFCSLLLTPLMRWLAIRNGIVDWPDFKRKSHVEPIAYLGGLAIFVSWLAGVFLCYFIKPHFIGTALGHMDHISFPITVALGAAVITLTGLFDDVYGLSPRVKIGGQFITAAMLVYQSDLGPRLARDLLSGVGLDVPPHLQWVPYTLGAILVAIFVVGGCNCLNLMDGLDGLAAGVSGIAAMGFLAIATLLAFDCLDPANASSPTDLLANPVRIVMCLAILGAVLGFLPYNFNPANIFMGDAGSLLLGYLSVSTILMFAETHGRGPLMVMAALIVFALPIADTTLAIFRRKIRGMPIFSPDNQHLHHQLRRVGLSVKRSVLVLYAMAAGFAVIGIVVSRLQWRYVIAVFLVIFGFILVTAYKAAHRIAITERLRETLDKDKPVAMSAPANSNGNGHTDAATPATQTQPGPDR
ncbi:MAG: undecaprenyl/decaprenyl-phosphate alpha-N-acetylglucosaminyl 1-phosphate transferase [Planctomycetes bacterium]|nr:undecaprenyl/decaprenyl-phosphate alpha-N-acetylglucosaminyl 1-phosphate transferase [Planctomycetota bacterium]